MDYCNAPGVTQICTWRCRW